MIWQVVVLETKTAKAGYPKRVAIFLKNRTAEAPSTLLTGSTSTHLVNLSRVQDLLFPTVSP